jgi:hypothetical protein
MGWCRSAARKLRYDPWSGATLFSRAKAFNRDVEFASKSFHVVPDNSGVIFKFGLLDDHLDEEALQTLSAVRHLCFQFLVIAHGGPPGYKGPATTEFLTATRTALRQLAASPHGGRARTA